MPPQQTNFTSETGRDAARLHLAAALVKDTTGNALAEARPDASIAALRDTLSEKEAAGPPVAPTWSLLSLLQEYWRAFRTRCLQGAPAGLHDLSDRHLKDIGLLPGDIDCIVARRAIERFRDDAMYL
jgi:uncharacterized protein YjiS (DUF1127 family)